MKSIVKTENGCDGHVIGASCPYGWCLSSLDGLPAAQASTYDSSKAFNQGM
jgi:hypothetical protein